MTRQEKIQLLYMKREQKIRKARKNFYEFCKVIDPILYKPNRTHLKDICDTLQGIYDGTLDKRKLALSIPPRHGKSRTLVLFCAWAFGVNPRNRIICCSYNDNTASDFSRYTRDTVQDVTKVNPLDVTYDDIFPTTKIKHGNASYEKWALEGQFFSYLGAGIGGSITGKGANIIIIDDPIKNAEEAFNETHLDKLWAWYTGTFLSRKEEGAIEIINHTRWSTKDIIGRVLNSENKTDWFVMDRPAYDEKTQKMLCEDILSYDSYKKLKVDMDELIFMANYQQQCIDKKGCLFEDFMVYNQTPEFERLISYTDTADTGKDALVSVVAGVNNGELYVLDVLYTKEAMEKTEQKVADLLFKYKPKTSKIESNNGGRGFARAVERIIWEKYGTRQVNIEWFHQSKNKETRILTASSYISKHMYFPLNFQSRWKEFYYEIARYQREGKNKHDDALDVLAGLVEMVEQKTKLRALRRI
jgi:predicted phage terminase large subunit-like protein